MYYHVSDDHGKGTVTVGTGPRWDTIKNLAAKINSSIHRHIMTAGRSESLILEMPMTRFVRGVSYSLSKRCSLKSPSGINQMYGMTDLSRINVPKLEVTRQTDYVVFGDRVQIHRGAFSTT